MTTTSSADLTHATRVWRKVALRIMPLIGIAYIMSYIDRANLGYVAQSMGADLDISTAQIGIASSLFFIGYILVEVPSNMALRRFGARKWIARIMLSWGVVTAFTALVQNEWQLYAARILLGFAEAGLAAGILLYLTFWFPRQHRGWATALFMMTIPLSGIVGAPFAAGLLSWGQSLLHMAGWRSLFLVEGVLTVFIGIAVLLWLTDRPAQARWLHDDEKAYIQGILDAEEADKSADGALHGLGQSLRSGKVWILAAAFFAIVFGLYPLAFFLPTMISNLSDIFGAPDEVGGVLLSAIPSAFAIICMAVWAKVGSRLSAVTATLVPMGIGVIGLLGATFTQSGVLFIVSACLSVAGIYTAMPQFWRIPTQALTGAAMAGGIALINSVSNLSGAIGPTVTGTIAELTGSFTWALLLIAVILILGMVVVFTVGRSAARVGVPED